MLTATKKKKKRGTQPLMIRTSQAGKKNPENRAASHLFSDSGQTKSQRERRCRPACELTKKKNYSSRGEAGLCAPAERQDRNDFINERAKVEVRCGEAAGSKAG